MTSAAVKALGATAWMTLLLAALAAVTARMKAYGDDYDLLSRPPLARLDTRLLTVVTLGHRGLWDDIAAIWTLQFIVDERLQTKNADAVQQAVLDTTRHHPQVQSLYMLTCFVLAEEFNRPDLCEPITQDGLQAFPDGWRIPVTQALVALERLKDPKAASAYYAVAASRPTAPDYLKSLTSKLIEKNALDPADVEATFSGLIGDDPKSRFNAVLQEGARRRKNRSKP